MATATPLISVPRTARPGTPVTPAPSSPNAAPAPPLRTLGLVLLDPDTENDVAYELCQLLGRAILPISQRDGRGGTAFGTAFFFTGPADGVPSRPSTC